MARSVERRVPVFAQSSPLELSSRYCAAFDKAVIRPENLCRELSENAALNRCHTPMR